MSDKVTPLFPNTPTLATIVEITNNIRSQRAAISDYINVVAELRREKYKALLRQGFDAKQALELSKDNPLG